MGSNKVINLIRDGANDGKKQLEFSAMEPTFYKDLPLIISKTKQYGYEVIHLLTNGIKISDKEYLIYLLQKGLNKITLSLHSHRDYLEAKITNNKTIFKKKIQALENIIDLQKKWDCSLTVNTVINNYNYQYLTDVNNFISHIGVKKHNIFFPHILGNAQKNFNKAVPRYSKIKKYLYKVVITAEKNGVNLSIINIPRCIINERIYKLDGLKGHFIASDPNKTEIADAPIEEKIKNDKCKKCAYFNSCSGISKYYIDSRGWSEFKPIKKMLPQEQNTSKEKHWVRLTKTCNQDCLFCLDKELQDGTALPMKEIEVDLKSGFDDGARRVVLSGGEPTIHTQFIEIIKLAKKIGYEHIQLITNGLKLSDDDFFKAAEMAELNEITVSIHGHNSVIHDKLVGLKGAFIKVLKTLKNAKKYPDLIISIDVCINKLNIRHLPEIIKTFIDAGFYEFDLLYIIPFGSAWENRKLLFFDIKKELPHLHKALDFSKDKKIHIWTNRLPAQYLEGYENLIQDPHKLLDEVKGRKKQFDDFFKKNKKIFCRGERCQYCFLQNFCQDLIKVKNGETLNCVSWPMCLGKPKFQKETHQLSLKDIFDDQIVDMKKFADFYIEERYYIKSLRCGGCKMYNKCDGAHIGLIKERGFKIFKPAG